MARIIVNADYCKGCGLCVSVCVKKIIRLSKKFNHKGYHPAEQFDSEKCNGCSMCAMICPDVAIRVER